jgi:hypothetical protein
MNAVLLHKHHFVERSLYDRRVLFNKVPFECEKKKLVSEIMSKQVRILGGIRAYLFNKVLLECE